MRASGPRRAGSSGRTTATSRWWPIPGPVARSACPRSTTSARAARPTASRTSTSCSAGPSARGSRRPRCIPSAMAATEIEWLEGGVTAVPGILAGGVAAGIKPSGKKDLALIYSSTPARAAAMFTSNQVKGAPVLVSMEHARGGQAQAIVASGGCANGCRGERGIKDAREMAQLVGELLRIPASHVLVASTGIIGVPLPMDKVRAALPKLAKSLSPQGGRAAAEAILTTDTKPKEAALRLEVDGRPVTLGGIAKGAGMLEPHLATMFCFAATDAVVAPAALHGADPNWGRIMAALGKSAARVEPDKVAIAFGGERIVERGVLREGVRLEQVREIMGSREYEITIDLGLGGGEDRVWTCDLSEEYVRINSKYTS